MCTVTPFEGSRPPSAGSSKAKRPGSREGRELPSREDRASRPPSAQLKGARPTASRPASGRAKSRDGKRGQVHACTHTQPTAAASRTRGASRRARDRETAVASQPSPLSLSGPDALLGARLRAPVAVHVRRPVASGAVRQRRLWPHAARRLLRLLLRHHAALPERRRGLGGLGRDGVALARCRRARSAGGANLVAARAADRHGLVRPRLLWHEHHHRRAHGRQADPLWRLLLAIGRAERYAPPPRTTLRPAIPSHTLPARARCARGSLLALVCTLCAGALVCPPGARTPPSPSRCARRPFARLCPSLRSFRPPSTRAHSPQPPPARCSLSARPLAFAGADRRTLTACGWPACVACLRVADVASHVSPPQRMRSSESSRVTLT
eukprot:2087980-Prymnesium_polylepis.2